MTRVERVTVDDGCVLEARTSGPECERVPWLLLHGGPGAWDYLGPLAALVDDAVRVHRFDFRGCGASEDSADYSIERLVADVEALRRHWGYRRWVVLGHSFGAVVALAVAWEHPETVAALGYLSGTGIGAWEEEYRRTCLQRLTDGQARRLAELNSLPVRSTGEERERLVLGALPEFVGAHDAAEWVASIPDRPVSPRLRSTQLTELAGWPETVVRQRCARLSMPVLAVRGAADPRPAAAVRRLAGTVPSGRFVEIEGAGHFPWVERPGRVREILLELAGHVR
jgi:proline iminopeptidase